MKESNYKSYDELPLFLNAATVAKVLGIAPSSSYDPIPDSQRGEIFFVHQFVAAGRRNAQHFRYCRRVQEQRQFVIILVD